MNPHPDKEAHGGGAMSEQKPLKWTVRKRAWPNGRPYFIVMKGKAHSGQVLISDKGGVSRFPSREAAQYWADEHNKEAEL